MRTLLCSVCKRLAPILVTVGLAVPFAHADVSAIIQECDSCHGDAGVSTASDVPSIAGFSPFVIEEYMFAYRDETRPCRESKHRFGDIDQPVTTMCAVAQDLTEAQIDEIADYYNSKPFVAAKQAFDADKAAVGAKIHRRDCEKCHSDGGSYADDDAGLLAGQWMPYLEQAFADFASGQREVLDEKMQEKIDGLDAESIAALLHYYASMQ